MINKQILVGRVGKDPQVKTFDNGNKVANFTLATSEKYTSNGEKVEDTEWHNITIYGKLADVVEKYVKKGHLLYLEGKKKTREYEKDGQKRYAVETIAFSMQILGGGDAGGNSASSVDEPDDLPF